VLRPYAFWRRSPIPVSLLTEFNARRVVNAEIFDQYFAVSRKCLVNIAQQTSTVISYSQILNNIRGHKNLDKRPHRRLVTYLTAANWSNIRFLVPTWVIPKRHLDRFSRFRRNVIGVIGSQQWLSMDCLVHMWYTRPNKTVLLYTQHRWNRPSKGHACFMPKCSENSWDKYGEPFFHRRLIFH